MTKNSTIARFIARGSIGAVRNLSFVEFLAALQSAGVRLPDSKNIELLGFKGEGSGFTTHVAQAFEASKLDQIPASNILAPLHAPDAETRNRLMIKAQALTTPESGAVKPDEQPQNPGAGYKNGLNATGPSDSAGDHAQTPPTSSLSPSWLRTMKQRARGGSAELPPLLRMAA